MMNQKALRRGAALLLALLMLLPGVSPAEEAVTEKDGWHFDSRGFLTGEGNPGEEYLLEDEEKGYWQYASRDLAITVTRTRDKPLKGVNRIREYCVADIWCSPASPMGAIMTEPYARFGDNLVSGKRQDDPAKLIAQQPSVLVVSDDMYGLRIMEVSKRKTKYDYHGVVIRYGDIKATKTKKSPEEGKRDNRVWPNLDTLAVYGDGSMKAFVSDAMTAEEYLAQGAVHVFAFGPWLISGGEINPKLYEDYYTASEPRVAIGMVEPYHYIILAVCGRPKERYIGGKLLWLAETLKEYGCTEALNLDGGDTVVMAFNNKIILQGDHDSGRNLGSLIAFGLREEPVQPAASAAASGEETPAAETAKTAKAKVNLREKTDKDSRQVARISKKGTVVTILEEAYDDDGMLWYYIRTEDGKEGYVRNDMLKKSD